MGRLTIDTAIPFGLQSAPKIFNALPDALLWIMGHNGVRSILHYLDDYLLFGDPESQQCAEALKLAVLLCEYLGVPIAKLKLERPVTVVVFLGIRLATAAFEIRLPQNKLVRLQALIRPGVRRSHVSSGSCYL